METLTKSNIYDRLLAINLRIDPQIQNPFYLNKCISECHLYIGEVERYSIQISKEISVLQQVLNNSLADFDNKHDNLLTQDENIKNLSSIRDREAKVNLALRQEISVIKKYQNEVTDLENLSKAVTLKLKNLSRVNLDIKVMLRIMDSQIKLNGGGSSNAVIKGLSEELNKGLVNKDSFMDAESEEVIENIIDPTSPIDPTTLFTEEINNPLTQPLDPISETRPEILPEAILEPKSEALSESSLEIDITKDLFSEPNIPLTQNSPVEGDGLTEMDLIISGVKELEEKKKESMTTSDIDVEDLFGPVQQKPAEPAVKTPMGIDMDDLFESAQQKPIEPVNIPLTHTPVEEEEGPQEPVDSWYEASSDDVQIEINQEITVDLNDIIEFKITKGGIENTNKLVEPQKDRIGIGITPDKPEQKNHPMDLDELLYSIQN